MYKLMAHEVQDYIYNYKLTKPINFNQKIFYAEDNN